MNEIETKDDLAGKVASLQSQVTVLLIALIIVSGTLTSFLFYQARTYGKDLDKFQPQAQTILKNYNDQTSNIQKFIQALQAYGQTHAEFQPILRKYGIGPTNSPARK